MAIKPAINPGVIAPERSVTPEQAQNFISGGAPLGSSVLSAAANKIVGFQRGATAVAARPPDLGSIIKTLSSNILNNVESRVQSINQTVNQIVNQRISELTGDYRDKVSKIDTNLPNKLLNSFLSLYNKALGYIQFFADKRNVSRLGDNLKALQEVFGETFNVAKVIRQQIVRIIDQLSNLPNATAGAGPGLSLDLKVPGGPLKKSAPAGLFKMMRRRPGMALAGAGALAAGGALVTSALSGPGAVKGEVTQDDSGLSGPILDRFNSILGRFQSAIDSLATRQPTESAPSSGSGSSSAKASGSKEDPGADVSGAPMSDTPVSKEVDSTGLKSNFAPIAQDIINSGKIDTTKLSDRAAMGAMLAVGQMETNFDYSKAYTGRGGLNNNMQGFIQLNRAVHPSSAFQSKKGYLDYTVPKFTGKSSTFTGGGKFNPLVFAEKLKNAKTGWEVAQALRAGGFTVNDFDPLDTAQEANRLTPDQVQAIKKIVFGDLNLQTTQPTAKAEAPPKAEVAPAPTQQENTQQLAQSVSQPPATVQTNVVEMLNPVNMSESADQGGGVQTVDSGTVQGGTVPFMTPTNEDNFLTLYSRIVYNIIDG